MPNLEINISKDATKFGWNVMNRGIEILQLPKGSKIKNVTLDRDNWRIIIEYERG